MKILSILFLAAMVMPVHRALAFTCEYYPDHNEIEISGTIGEIDIARWCGRNLSSHLVLPSVFFLSSPGGDIDQITDFVKNIKKLFEEAYRMSNVMPAVIVAKECSSACLPVLTAINQMAKEQLIYLVLDPDTSLGFHGCSDHTASDPQGHYSLEGTKRYFRYWVSLGGNANWLEQNGDLFETERITALSPLDARLSGSQIFDFAAVRNADAWLRDYRATTLATLRYKN